MFKKFTLDNNDEFFIRLIFGTPHAEIKNSSYNTVRRVTSDELKNGFRYKDSEIRVAIDRKTFLHEPIVQLYKDHVLMQESETTLTSVQLYLRDLLILFLFGTLVHTALLVFLEGVSINRYVLAFIRCFSVFIHPINPTWWQAGTGIVVSVLASLWLRSAQFLPKMAVGVILALLVVDSFLSAGFLLGVGPLILIVRYFILSKIVYIYCFYVLMGK